MPIARSKSLICVSARHFKYRLGSFSESVFLFDKSSELVGSENVLLTAEVAADSGIIALVG